MCGLVVPEEKLIGLSIFILFILIYLIRQATKMKKRNVFIIIIIVKQTKLLIGFSHINNNNKYKYIFTFKCCLIMKFCFKIKLLFLE